MLIPIVLGIAASSQIKPIKLLMPLVFGATIGADISIIGSPGNLIAKNTMKLLVREVCRCHFSNTLKLVFLC